MLLGKYKKRGEKAAFEGENSEIAPKWEPNHPESFHLVPKILVYPQPRNQKRPVSGYNSAASGHQTTKKLHFGTHPEPFYPVQRLGMITLF